MSELVVATEKPRLPATIEQFLRSAAKNKATDDLGQPRKKARIEPGQSIELPVDNKSFGQLMADLPALVLVQVAQLLPYDQLEKLCAASPELALRICADQADDEERTRLPVPQVWRALLARDFGWAYDAAECTHPFAEARQRIADAFRVLVLPVMRATDDNLGSRLVQETRRYRQLYTALLLNQNDPFTELIEADIYVVGVYRGMAVVRKAESFDDTSYLVPVPVVLRAFAPTDVRYEITLRRWTLVGPPDPSEQFGTLGDTLTQPSLLPNVVYGNAWLSLYSASQGGWRQVDTKKQTDALMRALGLKLTSVVAFVDPDLLQAFIGNVWNRTPLQEPAFVLDNVSGLFDMVEFDGGVTTLDSSVTFAEQQAELADQIAAQIDPDATTAAAVVDRDLQTGQWQAMLVPTSGVLAISDSYLVALDDSIIGRDSLLCVDRQNGAVRRQFELQSSFAGDVDPRPRTSGVPLFLYQLHIDAADQLHVLQYFYTKDGSGLVWSRVSLTTLFDGDVRSVNFDSIVFRGLPPLPGIFDSFELQPFDSVLLWQVQEGGRLPGSRRTRFYGLHIPSRRLVRYKKQPWMPFDGAMFPLPTAQSTMYAQSPSSSQINALSATEIQPSADAVNTRLIRTR